MEIRWQGPCCHLLLSCTGLMTLPMQRQIIWAGYSSLALTGQVSMTPFPRVCHWSPLSEMCGARPRLEYQTHCHNLAIMWHQYCTISRKQSVKGHSYKTEHNEQGCLSRTGESKNIISTCTIDMTNSSAGRALTFLRLYARDHFNRLDQTHQEVAFGNNVHASPKQISKRCLSHIVLSKR